MTVNLLRMAVGIDSVDHLEKVQAARREERRKRGERPVLMTFTRNIPKRAGDLADGGSIYWVVKRFIRVRQPIVAIERATNAEGRAYCLIELEANYIRTEMRPQKAFQGWRYLRPEDAPADVQTRNVAIDDIPPEMANELRGLGLL